jgi:hypothetical protein
MARRRGPGWKPAGLRLCTAALVAVLVAGCSYSAEEPGLFGPVSKPTEMPTEMPTEEPERQWPAIWDMGRRTSRQLPVAGEEIWTSGDGIQLTVRIAVHAVRRIEGGTVVDWSVTPLSAPGLGPNDVVPASVDLGLRRFDEGNTNVFLVDAPRGRLYRPLVHHNISRRCLCTPIWHAQRNLRIGRTALLQVSYPELPRGTTRIDVNVASVPMFSGVPVTPIGTVPLATQPTDLTRPPETATRSRGELMSGRLVHQGQRFQVGIERVVASDTNTSLEWTLRSLEEGPGLEEANLPPFADPLAPISYNTIAASGPRLRSGREELRPRLVTSDLTSKRTVECLCSDLRIWAKSLRSPGQQVSVVTNLPPLPRGLRQVEVVLPGYGSRRVPVTPAAKADLRAGTPQRRDVGTWSEQNWPRGWNSHNWPTMVPAREAMADYLSVTDRILR